MPGRKYTGPSAGSGGYRYGFNGKENDNEVKGEGNQQDYGMRIYDTRLGRFLSVDPLIAKYPWYSPYHFAGNNPIRYVDLDGGEPQDHSANYQYNNIGGKKSFYGGEIELNDPQLGRITVRMVNDVTTKQSWFVTKKPNTNEYMYYKAADGNHQSMHIQKNKGELPTVTGGQFLPYQTPEQIEDARRARVAGEFVDGFSKIYVGILAIAAALPAATASGGPLLAFNPLDKVGLLNMTVGAVSNAASQKAVNPDLPINMLSVASSAFFKNPFTGSAIGSAGSFDTDFNFELSSGESFLLNTLIGGVTGTSTNRILTPYAPKKFTTAADNSARVMTNTLFNFMTGGVSTGATNEVLPPSNQNKSKSNESNK